MLTDSLRSGMLFTMGQYSHVPPCSPVSWLYLLPISRSTNFTTGLLSRQYTQTLHGLFHRVPNYLSQANQKILITPREHICLHAKVPTLWTLSRRGPIPWIIGSEASFWPARQELVVACPSTPPSEDNQNAKLNGKYHLSPNTRMGSSGMCLLETALSALRTRRIMNRPQDGCCETC